MTPADDLRRAKALIEDPERWCCDGWGLAPYPANETRCMMHALQDIVGESVVITEAYDYLKIACGDVFPGDFNDTHTHAECLDALERAAQLADRAIALAEEDEK